MIKPRKSQPKSSETTLSRNSSHKENADAKTHHAETFATSAITTITNESAVSFNFGTFKIQFSCFRTFDKVRIQKVFPKDRVPGFSNTVDVKAMGVQLYCSDSTCSIFPLDGAELKPGQTYHHFLLKQNDREMMASVSLDIRPVTKPTAAKYTRDVQFAAAFGAFETKCRQAQDELREEIARILDIYADKVHADIPTQAPPVASVSNRLKDAAQLPRIVARKAIGRRAAR